MRGYRCPVARTWPAESSEMRPLERPWTQTTQLSSSGLLSPRNWRTEMSVKVQFWGNSGHKPPWSCGWTRMDTTMQVAAGTQSPRQSLRPSLPLCSLRRTPLQVRHAGSANSQERHGGPRDGRALRGWGRPEGTQMSFHFRDRRKRTVCLKRAGQSFIKQGFLRSCWGLSQETPVYKLT